MTKKPQYETMRRA